MCEAWAMYAEPRFAEPRFSAKSTRRMPSRQGQNFRQEIFNVFLPYFLYFTKSRKKAAEPPKNAAKGGFFLPAATIPAASRLLWRQAAFVTFLWKVCPCRDSTRSLPGTSAYKKAHLSVDFFCCQSNYFLRFASRVASSSSRPFGMVSPILA